jgi:uncharacterized protein YjbI with pentapeptide repeats
MAGERMGPRGAAALAETEASAAAGPEEPEFVEPKVALERIEALTTTARTTWLVLIGFLAFIGLTLLSVRDVDFFSISATTDLPIVNIAIPTTTFFWTAALLAAVLHTYFHVFLLKLWDALAEAPPVIDKLKLGDRVFPWLVNDWALRRRKGRPVTERPMDWLADSVTFLLIWLATPIVLAGFWWRSMPAHAFWLTLTIAVAMAVSLYASFHGWRRATARLRRPGPIDGCDAVKAPITVGWRRGATIAAILLVVISALRTEIGAIRVGPFQSESFLLARANLVDAEIAIEPDDWRDPEIARRRFHVQWCADAGIPEHACETPELPDQELARQRWCADLEIDIETGACTERFRSIDAAFEDEWKKERKAGIDSIRGPDLRGRDLRNANANGAFLAGVDLREARLEGADLYAARLEGADLTQARLGKANLRSARMEGANLTEARLEGANLRSARMEGANLRTAWLQEALLSGARLEGADLHWAQLEAADLGKARLKGASLSWARLQGADLSLARLEGAYLYQARLGGATLKAARLRGAYLVNAAFEAADLREARFEGAYLSGARLEGAHLGQARLANARLHRTRLDGSSLVEAQLQSAEWAGATLGPSPAHSADFTDGRKLTQSKLELVIGDERTFLPRDSQTGEWLHVWSCWEEEAAARFIEAWTAHRDITPDDLRQRLVGQGWICGPDNPRRPVGTPAEDVVGGYR